MTVIELIALLSGYPETTKVVLSSGLGYEDVEGVSFATIYSETTKEFEAVIIH